MLVEIFSLYVKGLILSSLTMILICLIWTLWRAKTKRDKTLIERQAFLYEMLMVAILTIPILSFAFMSILVVIKS
ncbi:amino acid ABC transporter [Streptococcus pyogenes JRS4]|uniref:Amino acid ABC transporter n=3 Tax=Streptococcus pyogenes TaxID=1314 RepID=Q99YK6_STRP1|nr:DUF4059 family protein [Streptococcus pyogenes]ABF36435.1 hypothetical membrane associated protein [Streptococcus pyogenes MGAS2096]AIG50674.1 membrane protein [Streptococcus pyogenes STAB901]EPZ43742.1 PF13268 family protein [Streptococcus pyogenes GA41345]EPZ48512.1 PF13268 family protein [Streptococcus pyogenes GA40634]EQL78275.1 PF13268 family protein [Streptococcus pyogenes GA19681]EQL79917.1 PF13268 family protein [Streptococcus pyogenes UTSW-2]ERL15579.1 PF13268 family protein [Str